MRHDATKYTVLQAITTMTLYRSRVGNFFCMRPSSEVSQNEGSHDCTHNTLYFNKVICHQTYTVLIRITMTIFTYLKH